VWQAKEFAGTYGTNGFHLDFADNSSNAALGTDTSGNSNTWTVNNLSVAAGAGNDSLRDSPTNGTQTDTGAGGEVVGQRMRLRANPSAGFSIVSLSSDGTNTIRTAGHGLNATPEVIISKNRDFADNWFVYHKDIQTDNKQRLNLNTTGAVNSSSSTLWAHTSSVIGYNGAQYVGAGTDDLIFYCFAPVEGYSAMGSYVGNGSGTAGPFVYLGFKPAFLLIKPSSLAGNWWIFDSKRGPHNINGTILYADLSLAEYTGTVIFNMDFLSNGFRLASTNSPVNNNGETFVYLAFAEHSFASNGGLAR
jgi:hypothetical protein